ncbi:putative bifunctional diguanylate cyclase/phosphodiesterase [Mycobacterium asiaticum]|uniref:putative bifunctional diguanylate cyclase/phosphodiesterase n=1 Tax=Mycobacterium asiaticum TaxID=1790 RepID=UPI0007EFA2A6|nr:EAL domain-containing protein [Mycobacterium asiaticum]OBI93101.1 diguanylate phosphodiesterase [Mycobacterium asiaticum]
MSAERSRARLYIFVVVTLLVFINSLALWGERAAHRGETFLQLGTGLAAIVCGLVVARRVSGLSRWWRLLYTLGVGLWLFGQTLWWLGDNRVDHVATAPGVAAHLSLPVLALVGVVLLVHSGGSVFGRNGLLWHPPIPSVIDGVVAGLSFLVLATMGGFGAGSSVSLPRSGIPAIEMVFASAEVVIVAAVVLIAMVYDQDRPYRVNYLLLAGGLVLMATSDRVVAYLRSVGAEGGDLWGGIGLILGPVMVAFAMLEYPTRPADADDPRGGTDWARLILPYIGFLGIAVLFAYHVLIGKWLDAFAVCVTVVMVLLVTIRQVIATRAQWLLSQRLYVVQRRLAHQVQHDALTGLPNRLRFARRLDEAMRDGGFVLIFIDLDDFKEINDRFGHAAGDELLCAVGERLKRCVADNDTLARIGGDEFAILIHEDVEELETVSDRLRVALRDPFPLQGSSVRVRASLGVVRPDIEDGPQTSDDLLRQADISMYAGKRLGKDTAVIYQPLTGIRADFPTALRKADGGVPAGFGLAYQPIVRVPEGTLQAVEALARWTAPNGMQIAPETFVMAAEAAGLGAALDAMVLDLACREVQAAGLDVDIHVNIGAARLGNTGFVEHVKRSLERHRIAPARLVVEITETVPIVDLADAAAQITRLHAIGVRVALDDFGAGYNSLTYLHALPVHIVKLDRSLAVGADPVHDLALYRSVIGLCGELGFSVVAEGIESMLQLDIVRAAGCHLAQGHLFGRPAPIYELARAKEWQRPAV